MPHGDIECGQIIVDKLAPFSFSSEIETTLFDFLDVRSILLAESQDGVHDSVRYLKIIEIRSFSGRIIVEDGAFCNCPRLERVYISYQFMRPIIGNEPFSNCPNAKIVFGTASTCTHGY